MSDERHKIDWHAGFAGGLELCFVDYCNVIDIEREYELTKGSPRIDFIVVKKDKAAVIDNDIGRTFKTYNIIEYKNPNDALNVDVVWKCIGYAGLYKGLGKTVDAVPEKEITISIFRSRYPRKFFEYCKKEGRTTVKTASGVYKVQGFSAIDLQIVVTRELEDESLLALKIMMADADKNDIRRFINNTKDIDTPGLLEDLRVVVKVSSSVNEALFEEVLKESDAMSTIEKLEQAREKALAESEAKGRAEGHAKGSEETLLISIRNLMRNMSISSQDAMKALGLDAQTQKKFKAML